MISLLQSDIKTALKSAFGILDGPMSVTDWCRGRNQSGESTLDVYSAESAISECRDVAPSIGEPLSPSLSCSAGSTYIKGIVCLYVLDEVVDFNVFNSLKFNSFQCNGWCKSGRDIPKKIKPRQLHF